LIARSPECAAQDRAALWIGAAQRVNAISKDRLVIALHAGQAGDVGAKL
jgi:hypothetical protein